MYSAKEARKEACNIANLEVQEELQRIEKAVTSQARAGRMRTTVSGNYSKITIEHIKELGYTVRVFADQRDGDYIEVSW